MLVVVLTVLVVGAVSGNLTVAAVMVLVSAYYVLGKLAPR